MAKKQHLSRLAAPKSWPVPRKGIKWIAKPTPGTHNLQTSLPLVVVLRDILETVRTSKEVKGLLHTKDILVNGKVPRDVRFPVGLFDIISIPKSKTNYQIIFNNKGKLVPQEIKGAEANLFPAKINGKTTVRGGKTQLNLSNGWNLLVAKDTYKVNDVVVIDLTTRKIKDHKKFDTGKDCYITAGKRIGRTGKLKEIKHVGLLKKENIAVLESKEGTFETRAEYLFVK